MEQLKSFGKSMFWFLVLLIAVMVSLKLLQKIPGVGPFAADAQHLAQDGSLA
jgi:hypothetical protein